MKYKKFVVPEQKCQEFAKLYEFLDNIIQSKRLISKYIVIKQALMKGDEKAQYNKMVSFLYHLDVDTRHDEEISDSLIEDYNIVIKKWYEYIKEKYSPEEELTDFALENFIIYYFKIKFKTEPDICQNSDRLTIISLLLTYLHIIVLSRL